MDDRLIDRVRTKGTCESEMGVPYIPYVGFFRFFAGEKSVKTIIKKQRLLATKAYNRCNFSKFKVHAKIASDIEAGLNALQCGAPKPYIKNGMIIRP